MTRLEAYAGVLERAGADAFVLTSEPGVQHACGVRLYTHRLIPQRPIACVVAPPGPPVTVATAVSTGTALPRPRMRIAAPTRSTAARAMARLIQSARRSRDPAWGGASRSIRSRERSGPGLVMAGGKIPIPPRQAKGDSGGMLHARTALPVYLTSLSKRGIPLSGAKAGSIRSQPGERK